MPVSIYVSLVSGMDAVIFFKRGFEEVGKIVHIIPYFFPLHFGIYPHYPSAFTTDRGSCRIFYEKGIWGDRKNLTFFFFQNFGEGYIPSIPPSASATVLFYILFLSERVTRTILSQRLCYILTFWYKYIVPSITLNYKFYFKLSPNIWHWPSLAEW